MLSNCDKAFVREDACESVTHPIKIVNVPRGSSVFVQQANLFNDILHEHPGRRKHTEPAICKLGTKQVANEQYLFFRELTCSRSELFSIADYKAGLRVLPQ